MFGLAGGGAAYYARHTAANSGTVYRLTTIQRGDVAPTISATGTLEAEDLINVGAQVAGLIVSFGKDIHGKQIDFNSVVEKDMVLATIDPVPYQAAVAQAEAVLENSQANLLQFEAKVVQTDHDLKRAERSPLEEGRRRVRLRRRRDELQDGGGQRRGGQGDHQGE